ncbi:uncharacterized protein Z519_02338 [Cladophialophora bantiana CBS 173.52]|uniref:Ribosomal protein S35, mitochondrial n=1 Tax=Cladophialophora bantiana (strain ATCC 10958 / CBS 173.52 / CDC B-1940 / NIH 8579) TaxID=1442370 RepID=A0A0D2GF17_CLAB1|nr:uncharacterized protein Z519_02338 [Cladophialophora bantiana CBS 173.52]KIW96947.1 hypothetical protein Z519_02338 [Cladophialophora bantiana CBS 173.52]
MPPRVSPSAVSLPLPTTPTIQTHCKSCFQRALSSTPSLSQTKLREQFWLWLRGPGENFRHPLPGSTNYLSAYDKRGNLIRGKGQETSGESAKEKSSEDAMTPDEEALEAAATEHEQEYKLPKETLDDLRPFPWNKHFVSQSILSEDLRNEIWDRVQRQGKSVRQVSIEMGVDMRRVAAVVRLVEVERRMRRESSRLPSMVIYKTYKLQLSEPGKGNTPQWLFFAISRTKADIASLVSFQGKPLALPYARAIHGMVPLTTLNPKTRLASEPHESINDLEQHPLTFPQIFYPTSESRAFNRTDAGRVFSGAPRLSDEQESAINEGVYEAWRDSKPEIIGKPGHRREVLKPADSRIPHPHLIAFEKDKLNRSLTPLERLARHRERLEKDEERQQALKNKLQQEEESKKTRIDAGRWQFVVTEVQSTRQGIGLNGRGSGKGAVGQRYGVPSQERKKGQVKIPTKVEV